MTPIENFVTLVAVGMTIGVLSAPFKENLYWKICEHIYLGLAAGYTLIMSYGALQSNMIIPLSKGDMVYLIPLILCVILYSGYAGTKYAWLNRYPIAVMVGVGTAVTMRTVADAMFIQQVEQTLTLNIFATSGAAIVGTPRTPLNNIILVIGTIATVLFFAFWELKPKRAFATIRQIGINFIMISFACEMAISIITRVTRLGGRFFFMLEPDSIPYTVIFTIVAAVSIFLAERAELKGKK